MKINVFLLLVALFVSGLIYYGFSSFEENTLQLACETAVCTIALVSALAVSITGCPRETVMFRTLAAVWFGVSLLVNVLFLVFRATRGMVVITDGLLFAGGLLGLYFIYKASHEDN